VKILTDLLLELNVVKYALTTTNCKFIMVVRYVHPLVSLKTMSGLAVKRLGLKIILFVFVGLHCNCFVKALYVTLLEYPYSFKRY